MNINFQLHRKYFNEYFAQFLLSSDFFLVVCCCFGLFFVRYTKSNQNGEFLIDFNYLPLWITRSMTSHRHCLLLWISLPKDKIHFDIPKCSKINLFHFNKSFSLIVVVSVVYKMPTSRQDFSFILSKKKIQRKLRER